MEYPENERTSRREQIDVNKMGDSLPMGAMWGLILALLSFLLVLICVVSVRMITREARTPGDVTDPSLPVEPTDPIEPVDPADPVTPSDSTTPILPGNLPGNPPKPQSFIMDKTAQTQTILSYTRDTGTGVHSQYAIFVDLNNNTVLADLRGDEIMFPASMTKVMTLLVACENLKEGDYDRSVAMSADIISAMQRENASGFGFKAGEVLTVRDLIYAVALESDCAASIQLAEFVAGSHEAFVQMMNEKCKDLGLTRTHFVNATGLHHDNHYTTCREMASIMAAAVANETVRNVMSQKSYVSSTNVHGRVTFRSTFFVDVLEGGGSHFTLPAGSRVVAAKTGSTDEAGKCLVCYIESGNNGYVIVTGNAKTANLYCSDYTSIYKDYLH